MGDIFGGLYSGLYSMFAHTLYATIHNTDN